MTENVIRTGFRQQADSCEALGSPLTARILRLLADHLQPGTAVADKVLGWPGDASSKADALGLRLVGGLHALVQSNRIPGLSAFMLPRPTMTLCCWHAIFAATVQHSDFLINWLDSPPQTNEVRRSAVMIAAAHWLSARFQLPMVLSELGSSAGLNLIWDHYALTASGTTLGPAKPALTLTPEWRGDPPDALPAPYHCARRCGP